MSAVGKAVLAPFKAIGSLFKPPRSPKVQPAASRDDIEEMDGQLQRLRRRRGAGANELLGPGGAEAMTGPAPAATGM